MQNNAVEVTAANARDSVVDAARRIVHLAVCGAVARGSGPSPPPLP